MKSSKNYSSEKFYISMFDTPDAHPSTFLHFSLSAESKCKDIPVFEYVSSLTGVRCFIAKVSSPLVNGFFTLATEVR